MILNFKFHRVICIRNQDNTFFQALMVNSPSAYYTNNTAQYVHPIASAFTTLLVRKSLRQTSSLVTSKEHLKLWAGH